MPDKKWSESPILFDKAEEIDDTDPRWTEEDGVKNEPAEDSHPFFSNHLGRWWKKQKTLNLFRQRWEQRNIRCSNVFVDSLEVPYQIFQQEIFIENKPEIVEKLARLGFQEVDDKFKDEVKRSVIDFCELVIQTDYNIVLHLYPKAYENTLAVAIAIAGLPITEASNKHAVEKSIFKNTLEVLT